MSEGGGRGGDDGREDRRLERRVDGEGCQVERENEGSVAGDDGQCREEVQTLEPCSIPSSVPIWTTNRS